MSRVFPYGVPMPHYSHSISSNNDLAVIIRLYARGRLTLVSLLESGALSPDYAKRPSASSAFSLSSSQAHLADFVSCLDHHSSTPRSSAYCFISCFAGTLSSPQPSRRSIGLAHSSCHPLTTRCLNSRSTTDLIPQFHAWKLSLRS